MSPRATKFGCLTLLLLVTFAVAALSWSEGGLEHGAGPPFVFFIGLLIIYGNDYLERRRARRRNENSPKARDES